MHGGIRRSWACLRPYNPGEAPRAQRFYRHQGRRRSRSREVPSPSADRRRRAHRVDDRSRAGRASSSTRGGGVPPTDGVRLHAGDAVVVPSLRDRGSASSRAGACALRLLRALEWRRPHPVRRPVAEAACVRAGLGLGTEVRRPRGPAHGPGSRPDVAGRTPPDRVAGRADDLRWRRRGARQAVGLRAEQEVQPGHRGQPRTGRRRVPGGPAHARRRWRSARHLLRRQGRSHDPRERPRGSALARASCARGTWTP